MINTIDSLRAFYPDPKERAVKKQLDYLDVHCARYISLSPFLIIATAGSEGHLDASPRGGDPGFVKIVDETTLLIPDAPGNNRLDTLSNIIATGRVGLLFLIPGIDETLRVNGDAQLSDDELLVQRFSEEKRLPKIVIKVKVAEAYLHCAKAFMRSKLWDAESRVDRSVLPAMSIMINDQVGSQEIVETQEQMLARYMKEL